MSEDALEPLGHRSCSEVSEATWFCFARFGGSEDDK
jgi:hypothetical protein